MNDDFQFAEIPVSRYHEPGSSGNNEWYGRGKWRGATVLVSISDVPGKDYFICVVEADMGANASRYFRISSRGRTPQEAFDIVCGLVGVHEKART